MLKLRYRVVVAGESRLIERTVVSDVVIQQRGVEGTAASDGEQAALDRARARPVVHRHRRYRLRATPAASEPRRQRAAAA